MKGLWLAVAILLGGCATAPATPPAEPGPLDAPKDALRDEAIERFEAFLESTPNDPRFTPEALMRLADLYADRAEVMRSLQAEAAEARGEEPRWEPSNRRFIAMYSRVLREFPTYEHADAAAYLLGYYLIESGLLDQGQGVFEHIVCANRFPLVLDGLTEAAEARDRAEAPPAAAPSASETASSYVGCEPAWPASAYLTEVWMRIGDHCFDFGSLDEALEAYARVLRAPDGRFWTLAQYKTAWTHYRSDRYADAVRAFAALLGWIDAHPADPGADLRAEVVDYLAVCFAEDDWDLDGIPDGERGGPTPVDRLTDERLVPQGAPFLAEVYERVGDMELDVVRPAGAEAVWAAALQRWPLSERAESISEKLSKLRAGHGARP